MKKNFFWQKICRILSEISSDSDKILTRFWQDSGKIPEKIWQDSDKNRTKYRTKVWPKLRIAIFYIRHFLSESCQNLTRNVWWMSDKCPEEDPSDLAGIHIRFWYGSWQDPCLTNIWRKKILSDSDTDPGKIWRDLARG